MRRVARPEHGPHVCSFTLKGEDPEGFFTTNTVIRWGRDPVAYIAVSAVRQAARELGMVSSDEHGLVVGELERANRRVAQLEDEVAEMNRDFEAIDLLQSKGFTARKKPGRKPAAQEV